MEDQEEEDELRARLHNISVTEEVPPGFAALTKQQLTQYRDALNVSPSAPRSAVDCAAAHLWTPCFVSLGLIICIVDQV